MASGLYVGNTGIGMVRVGVFSSNGVDTSDATATASNIESGKTAYVNGDKITGTLPTASRVGYAPLTSNNATVTETKYTDTLGNTHTMIRVKATSATAPSGKAIINPSSTEVFVEANPSDFGNATAADVTSGKTFTSSAGLKVTGTRTSSSGSSGSGIDTSDATASASDILSGKTAYVNGSKITGTIKSKAAATVTPSTSDQTIASGQYLSGAQTIKGDSNLVAGNIKKGTSIFGVTGTLETGSTGIDTSDATATASHILSGKTAYVNGQKITGTMSSKSAATYTPSTSNQTIASGQYLSGAQTIKGDSNLVASNIRSGVSIFGVSGTYSGSSSSGSGNNNCEAYVITSTSATVSFKNTSGTIKVFGYGKTTSSSGWGSSTTSVLAFCGDKYYKSVSYGSPTSTSLSLSINSDGTISGLPSMTECNLLVTRGV